MKPRIVIVGGGSNSWAPNIVKDMMLTASLANADFVLYDIDRKASDLNKRYLDKIAAQLGVSPRIVSTDNRSRALRNADYVLITISTGGLRAMGHDLSIPEQYGIYHTVGDTSGPGGWSRSLRNRNAFVELAGAFNRYCPDALILNYTNPMTVLTDILERLCPGRVIGLCHGLFENLQFLADLYGVTEDELQLKYAGLNHFFWITEARAKGCDILAGLRRRLKKKSISELLARDIEDPMGFRSGRQVADELFRLTNFIPYLGDRHTCEFFSWYITDRKRMRECGIIRTCIEERRTGFAKRKKRLKTMIKGKIDDRYLVPSRETAADIINAHLTNTPFVDVGNLKNTGQVSNLPRGTVVETSCRIPSSDGSSPGRGSSMRRPTPASPGIARWRYARYDLIRPATISARHRCARWGSG